VEWGECRKTIFSEESIIMRRNVSFGSPLEEIVGYSRAVVMGNWCFCAGVTGSDPVTKSIPDDIQSQIENAFSTVERVLKESGFEMKDVVRVTYYVTESGMHDTLAPQFGKRFGSIRPAATYLEVSGLAYAELKFEIEVTAMKL
jgi:enamine deaminase RidA (YjgF/YER057c/UK114 family)